MTAANRITLFRLMMVPVFLGCVFCYSPDRHGLRYAALAVYALAAASDVADGYVARRYRQHSKLGARMDPLADKLIVNLGFVFMAANESFTPGVPMWFPVIILMRDVIIVMGAFLINECFGPVKVKPRISGKMTTVFQMGTLIGVLLGVQFVNYLLMATVILTFASMADYVYAGIRQATLRNPA